MARFFGESCDSGEVVYLSLMIPCIDYAGYVGITHGEVFACWSSRVAPLAVGGPRSGGIGEGGVPGQSSGIVLLTEAVRAVER
jgi:hypothetical protein